MILTLKLPFPPSVNHYYDFITVKAKGGKSHISKKLSKRGINFKADVLEICSPHRVKSNFGDSRLSLHIAVTPPDNRRRDMDNLGKAIQDSLCEAGLFDDDSQIDELHFSRKAVEKPGYVVINLISIPVFDG